MRGPNSEVMKLVQAIACAIHQAPLDTERRARWVRGFTHGYLGMPFEVVDGITYEKDFTPVVHSPDPYRQGYFVGQRDRMSPN